MTRLISTENGVVTLDLKSTLMRNMIWSSLTISFKAVFQSKKRKSQNKSKHFRDQALISYSSSTNSKGQLQVKIVKFIGIVLESKISIINFSHHVTMNKECPRSLRRLDVIQCY